MTIWIRFLQDTGSKQFVHTCLHSLWWSRSKNLFETCTTRSRVCMCVYRTTFVLCKCYTMYDEMHPCRHKSLSTPTSFVLHRTRHTPLPITRICVHETIHWSRHSRQHINLRDWVNTLISGIETKDMIVRVHFRSIDSEVVLHFLHNPHFIS